MPCLSNTDHVIENCYQKKKKKKINERNKTKTSNEQTTDEWKNGLHEENPSRKTTENILFPFKTYMHALHSIILPAIAATAVYICQAKQPGRPIAS